jgi:hypothetical protein
MLNEGIHLRHRPQVAAPATSSATSQGHSSIHIHIQQPDYTYKKENGFNNMFDQDG